MKLSKSNREVLLCGIIVLLSVYRFSYFGFRYIPYLDDYVQYSFYPSLSDAWKNVYAGGTGVLFSRPLAGLLDLFLWSKMYSAAGLAVAILALMHGTSAIFFYKGIRHCGIEAGLLFLAFYTFMPINCEGTYWLSAASRIVPSMLLVSLSLFFGAKGRTLPFAVFTFLSMWFYEQTAVLSFGVATAVCIIKREYLKIGVPLISFAALVVFYLSVGGLGDNAHRMGISDIGEVLKNFKNTILGFVEAFTKVQSKIMFKGFARGFKLIAKDFSLIWIGVLCVLIMCACTTSEENRERLTRNRWVLGVVFLFLPLLPFLVSNGSFFNLRNAVPCALGAALLFEGAVSFLSGRLSRLIAGVLMFVFIVSNVSEVSDYTFVAKRDYETAVKISEQVSASTNVISVKLSSPVYYPQNAPYGDHIMSMTGSDWGVTGIVRTLSKNPKLQVIQR